MSRISLETLLHGSWICRGVILLEWLGETARSAEAAENDVYTRESDSSNRDMPKMDACFYSSGMTTSGGTIFKIGAKMLSIVSVYSGTEQNNLLFSLMDRVGPETVEPRLWYAVNDTLIPSLMINDV